MVKPLNIAIALALVIVCVGAIGYLLLESSVPIYSVQELMDKSDIESLIGKRIQVVGTVVETNASGFKIRDPEDTNNTGPIIFIEDINVERPTGFEIGKTVLVEGKLLSTTFWKFKATLISTKCPSKYLEEK
ncbi:MAG: cytochrome c maturation protein CcmE [Promethearchaeota archaeon]